MHVGAFLASDINALMREALNEASIALSHDDVPIGAVIARATPSGATEIIGRGHNRREVDHDPTAHAEVLALRAAARHVGSWHLDNCLLIATLEPCPMCAGAALNARVGAIVFGAPDPKAGACGTLYNFASDPRLNHSCSVQRGVLATECAAMLREFFATKRSTS